MGNRCFKKKIEPLLDLNQVIIVKIGNCDIVTIKI